MKILIEYKNNVTEPIQEMAESVESIVDSHSKTANMSLDLFSDDWIFSGDFLTKYFNFLTNKSYLAMSFWKQDTRVFIIVYKKHEYILAELYHGILACGEKINFLKGYGFEPLKLTKQQKYYLLQPEHVFFEKNKVHWKEDGVVYADYAAETIGKGFNYDLQDFISLKFLIFTTFLIINI